MTDDGGRRTEDGGQTTEDGGQMTDDGGQTTRRAQRKKQIINHHLSIIN